MQEYVRRVEAEGDPRTAKIVLVGEAPGTQEVMQRKPFVGPAGNLLNNIIQSAGLLREQVYITNVIKEQPPKTSKKSNDISVFVEVGKKDPIETDRYKEYLEELKEELEKVETDVIVAFGNVPLYALTGIFPPKITKRRGSIYPCTLVKGKKVVATIHPAACLHGGDTTYVWRHFILHDIRKAIKEIGVDGITEDKYTHLIKPAYTEVMLYLDNIMQTEMVAFDIEVINLEVSCISIAHGRVSMSIPFMIGGQEYFDPEQEAEIWLKIASILEDERIRKVGQNLMFDIQFLFRKYGIRTRNIDDTMIGQAIIVPEFPKGLDFINSIYGSTPYYKDEGKQYMKIGGRDEDFWLYNSKDSTVCLEAMPQIMDDIRSIDNEDVYNRQKSLIEILLYMSERGIRMDVDGLKGESERVGNRIEELKDKLNRMVGYEINTNSPKQLAEYFYEVKRYKAYKKRGTGAVTTDEDALKRLARKGAPEASILLEIRRLSKLKSTYLDVQLDEDNRLRCSYNPVGAADSGRISSSKTIWGTGMNLQNDPPEFKRFMMFDEGYVGYNMDLGQAENRIVAYIAPELHMIEAFEEGKDIHSLTGGLISGIDPDEIKRQDEEGIKCNIGQGVYTWRFWGKKANHGLNYGLGYRTFAFYYEIPEADARFIVSAYHNAYPGIGQYHNWIREQLSKDRTITNIYGRHRIFMGRWGEGIFKEAYSFIPQSTVADKIIHTMREIYYDQSRYSNVELLNQVHDSIVFQIPLSISWEEQARILLDIKREMEAPLEWRGRKFTIPADLQMGRRMHKGKGGLMDVEWDTDVDRMAMKLRDMWKKV